MARGRVIRPEIWADEKFTSLPFEGRLLFIALWNFADDNGILVNSPTQIRMEAFPAEGDPDIPKVRELIGLMAGMGMLVLYTVYDDRYLLVKNFNEHQKVPRPSYQHPTPLAKGTEVTSGSLNGWRPRPGTPLNLADGAEGDSMNGFNESNHETDSLNSFTPKLSEVKSSESKQSAPADDSSRDNPPGHPFSVTERVLSEVNKALGWPPPSATDVRREMKNGGPLRELVAEYGEVAAVQMKLHAERTWKGTKAWAAVYSQRHALASQIGKPSPLVSGGPPGSPPLRLLSPDEASCDAEAAEVARRHREQARGE